MDMHEPVIQNYGLYAEHDVACPVCNYNKALLNLDRVSFEPCWQCQKLGWEMKYHKSKFANWRYQWRRKHWWLFK